MTRVPKNQSQSQKHETGRFWVSMLCTLGVSSRREQCSGATPAVPHLVLQATWWVVDISADTANIRCHIIVGCAPNPTMPRLLLQQQSPSQFKSDLGAHFSGCLTPHTLIEPHTRFIRLATRECMRALRVCQLRLLLLRPTRSDCDH